MKAGNNYIFKKGPVGCVSCAVRAQAVMAVCCRYLALVAALTSEADYVFIPENPPPENWGEKICSKLKQARRTNLFMHLLLILIFLVFGSFFQACFPSFIPNCGESFVLACSFPDFFQFSS